MAKNWIRESIEKVESAAENGNPAAQIELAKRYFTGRDVSRDPKEGFTWTSHAAEHGFVEAVHMLGHCYATGTGITASGRKAFECFVKAAFADHKVAVYNLAVCYDYGIGVERDWHMANRLYEKASNLGYSKAKHILVARLWNRDTTDTSSARRDAVLSWYAAQANKGDELARRNLALVRRNRKVRVDKELELD